MKKKNTSPVRYIWMVQILLAFLLVGCGKQSEYAITAACSENPAERLKSIDSLKDQRYLALLAKDCRFEEIKNIAVKKLTAPEFLIDVAINSDDATVADQAISKISDQILLADVALKTKYYDRTDRIISKISDQALLVKFAKQRMSQGGDVVFVSLVTNIKDRDTLAQMLDYWSNFIVENNLNQVGLHVLLRTRDPEGYDKINLFEKTLLAKVDDQKALARFLCRPVFSEENGNMALERITENDLLNDIVSKTSDGSVRKKAIMRIRDQAMLADLVMKYVEYRSDVLPKITDQVILLDILQKVKKMGFSSEADRDIAVAVISAFSEQTALANQALLADIALGVQDGILDKKALLKIKDQVLLASIVYNGKSGEVRRVALSRITDQLVLVDILLKAAGITEPDMEDTAKDSISKITDQALLGNIVLNLKSAKLSGHALSRITDQTTLLNILQKVKELGFSSEADRDVAAAVISAFSEQTALANQALLIDILKRVKNRSLSEIKGIIEAMIPLLTDQTLAANQELLASVALKWGRGSTYSDWAGDYTQILISKITDQVVLADILINARSSALNEKFMPKITSYEALNKIAESGAGDVSWLAKEKIKTSRKSTSP